MEKDRTTLSVSTSELNWGVFKSLKVYIQTCVRVRGPVWTLVDMGFWVIPGDHLTPPFPSHCSCESDPGNWGPQGPREGCK